MKKGIFSRIGFVIMIIAISLAMPTVTLGASLRLISEASYEDARFNPPNPPFAPYDPNNPDFSIDGMIEGLIGVVLDWLGISPVGSIYGPGISTWDNYVGFMGQDIYAQASAVGTVASWDPFLIGDTQYVKDWWHWAAIYELDADPGETVDVRLDYAHDYTYYNLALAGRSRAVTDVKYGAYIIPAARTWAYSQEAANNLGYRDNPNTRPADASFWGSFSLHGGAQYTYLGGFTEDTDHKIGSFELGSMSVGDRLYVYGYLYAATECEMYTPPTLDVATMFPSFQAWHVINGNITASPASSDFGLINVGSSSVLQTFQVSNKRNTDVLINSITLSGPDVSDFRIKGTTCSWTPLLPSQDCIIEVAFVPATQGIKNVTLSIVSNDPDFPSLGVVLTGEATSNPVFEDCQEDHWAEDFINTLYYSGITGGCSADPPQFCPDTAITRGQMAVFIEASLGHPPNTCTGRFTDVPVGNPFCGFIERMADDGITGGCGGNNFCPDAPVTRGQMAVFIIAALRTSWNVCEGRFADVPASNEFCGFIERLADDGITGGCSPDHFCPDDPVTRGQMAVFLVAAPPPLSP